MSKRRSPGDIVKRKPGSCFIGNEYPQIVRLSDSKDGDLHYIDSCPLCDDPECQEWANVHIVGIEDGWLFHLSECQMEDVN